MNNSETTISASRPSGKKSAAPWLDIPFASNCLRLSTRLWIITLLIVVAGLWGLRMAWGRLEPIPRETNYRVPFSLGNDYWFYRRLSRQVEYDKRIALLGDSVLWGHYVKSDEALSAQLNAAAKSDLFCNLAVNGLHPASMEGLLRHYGAAIHKGRNLILFNPLWITSKRQDLTDPREFSFNHPDLVPQFFPKMPCYVKSSEGRLAIVMRRYLPWLGWGDHVRMAYYGNQDLGHWCCDHPYRNPLRALTFKLPAADELPDPPPDTNPWHTKNLMLSASWVQPADSLQWRSFMSALELQQQRGNAVFVIINPMNEHMMSDETREAYQSLRSELLSLLAKRGMPALAPSTLPSDLYADSSHPLAQGYAIMAQELLANGEFKAFCGAAFE